MTKNESLFLDPRDFDFFAEKHILCFPVDLKIVFIMRLEDHLHSSL